VFARSDPGDGQNCKNAHCGPFGFDGPKSTRMGALDKGFKGGFYGCPTRYAQKFDEFAPQFSGIQESEVPYEGRKDTVRGAE
jgi:hypothetical protein